MNKYYIIQNIETGLYMKAMSHDYCNSITDCGTWASEESALNWINSIKGVYFTIIPVYRQFN